MEVEGDGLQRSAEEAMDVPGAVLALLPASSESGAAGGCVQQGMGEGAAAAAAGEGNAGWASSCVESPDDARISGRKERWTREAAAGLWGGGCARDGRGGYSCEPRRAGRLSQSFTAVMMTQIGAMQARVSRCERQVDRLDGRVQQEELQMSIMQAQMEEFRREMALTKVAEPTPMPSQVLGQEAWDHAPEGNVLRANCSGMVALKVVQDLVDELAAGGGAPKKPMCLRAVPLCRRSLQCAFWV